MENRDILISRILSTPPYQLPPVVHAGGLYHLDISFRGEKLCKIGNSLEECLQSYYHFVTKRGHIVRPQHSEPLTDLPVRLGAELSNQRPF